MYKNISLPKILAIETSTHACSVALYIAGHDQTQDHSIVRYEVEPRVHTRIVLPMINGVLKEAGFDLSQITAFAYGCGPGSFTGVRIASSVIQGLAFGTEKPVIAISSLRALAQQKNSKDNICAIIDARMNQVYWGLFKTNLQGIVESFGNENLSARQDIVLPEREDWVMCEDYPRAEEVAMLAKIEYLEGRTIRPQHALPVYLRSP